MQRTASCGDVKGGRVEAAQNLKKRGIGTGLLECEEEEKSSLVGQQGEKYQSFRTNWKEKNWSGQAREDEEKVKGRKVEDGRWTGLPTLGTQYVRMWERYANTQLSLGVTRAAPSPRPECRMAIGWNGGWKPKSQEKGKREGGANIKSSPAKPKPKPKAHSSHHRS